jgi:hypothetical protein
MEMDTEKKRKLEQINAELEQNNIELIAYLKAMRHADAASRDAMEAHVDELFRERCRIMGLPENGIARIEQESEKAVDEQVAAEISTFLKAVKAAQQ